MVHIFVEMHRYISLGTGESRIPSHLAYLLCFKALASLSQLDIVSTFNKYPVPTNIKERLSSAIPRMCCYNTHSACDSVQSRLCKEGISDHSSAKHAFIVCPSSFSSIYRLPEPRSSLNSIGCWMLISELA